MTEDAVVHSGSTAREQSRRERTKSFFAAAVGNAIEWYDWTIYSIFAVYFSGQFFAPGDPAAALLATFGIFAVGFFVRPLGGVILGIYADRAGRKSALTLTIVLMAVPTFMLAVAPTYEHVGLLAPIILLISRLLQGFAAGGESGGSMAYLSEIAPNGRRGMYSSMWYSTVAAGMIIATLLGFILARVLSDAEMDSFGWRIPFIMGGLAGLSGLWIRKTANESPAFASSEVVGKPVKNPLKILFRDYPRQTLRVVALTAGASVGFYTLVSYMPTLLIKSVELGAEDAFVVHTIALVVFMLALPALGRLSDSIGRRPVGLIYCFGGAIAIVPLTANLKPTFWSALLIDTALIVLLACMYAVIAALMAEQFPTEMRSVGIGTPYNLATAIFGGTAPYLLTWFKGLQATYFGYMALLMMIAGVTLYLSKESHTTSMTAVRDREVLERSGGAPGSAADRAPAVGCAGGDHRVPESAADAGNQA